MWINIILQWAYFVSIVSLLGKGKSSFISHGGDKIEIVNILKISFLPMFKNNIWALGIDKQKS